MRLSAPASFHRSATMEEQKTSFGGVMGVIWTEIMPVCQEFVLAAVNSGCAL